MVKKKKSTAQKATRKRTLPRQKRVAVKQHRSNSAPRQSECDGVNVCICQIVGFLIMVAGCLGLLLIILWLYSCLPLGIDKPIGEVRQTQVIIETDG